MKAIGRENTWFKFKGIRNDALGVRMLSMPTRPHPARKGKVISIPGTDGELWQDEGGYKRIIIPIRLITESNENIDAVNAWLSGEGDLIFGDEPDRAYHARITKEFSRSNRSQRLRGQEFTVSFDCEPFRYRADPSNDTETLTIDATAIVPVAFYGITNDATVASLPLLKIENTNGGCIIEAGGKTLVVQYHTSPIFVDCEAKFAYTFSNGSRISAAPLVSGDWLQIAPGATSAPENDNPDFEPIMQSYMTVASTQNPSDKDNGNGYNQTTVTITPRYRWL